MPHISVDATLLNKTNKTLTLVTQSQHLDHGEWTIFAPPSIDPHDVGEWSSESDGFVTGTEGHLNYFIEGEPPEKQVFCYWDNPFAGSNSYNATAPAGYQIQTQGSPGDNSIVIYKLTKGQPSSLVCALLFPG